MPKSPEHIVSDRPHHRHTEEVCAACGAGWVPAIEGERTLVMQHATTCAFIRTLENA